MPDEEILKHLINKAAILGVLDRAGLIRVGDQGQSIWSKDGSDVTDAAAFEAHAVLTKKKNGGARPGAGRPKLGFKRGTISLSPSTWEKLKIEAAYASLSNSEMLEHIIQEYRH